MTGFLILVAFFFLCGTTLFGFLWWTTLEKVTSAKKSERRAEQAAKQAIAAVNEQLAKCHDSHRALHAKAEARVRELAESRKATVAELARMTQAEARARQNIALLRKDLFRWQSAIDAEAEGRAEAARIIAEASAEAASLRTEAEKLLAVARKSADTLRLDGDRRFAEAQKQAHTLKLTADGLVAAATERAADIVAKAETQAKKIAGDAYELKSQVAAMEKTLKAIRNQIEGYGDEYIVPAHSLLDDLADEVGYKEAGQKLKAARDRTREMVRNEAAASCDYAEEKRRQTAIKFVVDAFNGKVDSALSLVKHDNAGKLSQEIWDAFTVVNMHGEAFKNARITPEYLKARLDELKWAATAQELKRQEAEEQRQIRERIREEEKARREYDRAIKEAAKEEAAVQKAMDRLSEQMAKANESQRAEYEAQLSELQGRLQAAEERGQRAMSMAQLTQSGHVYIISNIGSFGENVYKIGLTRRLDPLDRVRELGDSSVPFSFDVHALIQADDAPALEHRLHRHFLIHQVNKVNHRKEFFRVNLETIRSEVEGLGLTPQWTMAAEAAQYRESLAIERRIAEDPVAREQWLLRQFELEGVDDDLVDEDDGLVSASASNTEDE
jgi:chromosome segregation ATPase